jgi:hypothetical protein
MDSVEVKVDMEQVQAVIDEKIRPGRFNFGRASMTCPRLNKRVHVIKALLGVRDNARLNGAEKSVLSRTVEYIKVLETEILRLESTRNVVINVAAKSDVEVKSPFEVPSSIVGRLFRGR